MAPGRFVPSPVSVICQTRFLVDSDIAAWSALRAKSTQARVSFCHADQTSTLPTHPKCSTASRSATGRIDRKIHRGAERFTSGWSAAELQKLICVHSDIELNGPPFWWHVATRTPCRRAAGFGQAACPSQSGHTCPVAELAESEPPTASAAGVGLALASPWRREVERGVQDIADGDDIAGDLGGGVLRHTTAAQRSKMGEYAKKVACCGLYVRSAS